MKNQHIAFGLLIAALTVTSCKNAETPAPETAVETTAATAENTFIQKPATTADNAVKPEEKAADEANEKNEK